MALILELITATINTVKKLDGSLFVFSLIRIVATLLGWGLLGLALYGLLLWIAVELAM